MELSKRSVTLSINENSFSLLRQGNSLSQKRQSKISRLISNASFKAIFKNSVDEFKQLNHDKQYWLENEVVEYSNSRAHRKYRMALL